MSDFDILSGFNNIDILKNAPEQKEKKDYRDPRFWKLAKDKNGDGKAVIRLLTDKNKIPYVRIYHYSSKKKIGDKEIFLIENSPSSLGDKVPCPIKEHYFELVNQGLKEEAKMFSRKVKYYTNIYVEKDPANPENEGKVFLWEFGQKLLDKFTNWMTGDPDMGEAGKELFNPLAGNSIKLVINKNENSGFFEYDRTNIMPSTTSVGGITDKNKIVDILLNQTYDLNEFKSPEYFKSYEKLKEALNRFINPFKKEEATLNIQDDYTPAIKENQEKTSSQETKQDDEMPDWFGGDVSTETKTSDKEVKKEEQKPQTSTTTSTSEKEEDWYQDFEEFIK